MNDVTVNLNYLGYPITKEFVDALVAGEIDKEKSMEYSITESFLELSLDSISRDVLDRYVELSDKAVYTPFLPYSDKLFERLLSPYRSAKRCYCLGEYLATIELCAHVGEMLAQLLWEISEITHNKNPVTPEFEKSMWGRTFEKLGQERRIEVLKAFDVLNDSHKEDFNYLRTTRIKYYHIWSASTENIVTDSKECFVRLAKLIKDILQMDISKSEKGKITINPLLSKYMSRTKAENGAPSSV